MKPFGVGSSPLFLSGETIQTNCPKPWGFMACPLNPHATGFRFQGLEHCYTKNNASNFPATRQQAHTGQLKRDGEYMCSKIHICIQADNPLRGYKQYRENEINWKEIILNLNLIQIDILFTLRVWRSMNLKFPNGESPSIRYLSLPIPTSSYKNRFLRQNGRAIIPK